ncbi:MAG: galactose oxidase, partial [Verrucomicrobia bacterium]|nr:galactose oxidase [Verrucomicrobiota bacterium]
MISLGHSSGTAATIPLRWNQLASLPDREGVAGSFAGVSSGVLLVGGGANFPGKKLWEGGEKVWHDTVYALGQPSGTWSAIGKLPRPLAYGISVTSGEQIVCIGGSDARRHYPDVFALAFVAGQLKTTPLPSLPIPMANGAGVLLGGSIYVCGGSERPGEKSALHRLFTLNQAQTRWEELEPCPGKPRLLPVMAAVGNSVYLAGGSALEETNGKPVRVPLNDTWKYQPGRGWARLADLPRASVAAPSPAPVIASTFLIIGGDVVTGPN